MWTVSCPMRPCSPVRPYSGGPLCFSLLLCYTGVGRVPHKAFLMFSDGCRPNSELGHSLLLAQKHSRHKELDTEWGSARGSQHPLDETFHKLDNSRDLAVSL